MSTVKKAKQTETAVDIIIALIQSAKKGKQAYRDNIQKALELFVNEYNGALRYETKYFKEIVMTVGKDIKDLRNWIFTYTNITGVSSDLNSFRTADYVERNGKKLYTLKFKDDYNGQLWYSIETDKKAIKELTNDTFANSLKALYKRYINSFVDYDDKTTKILEAIKETYALS